MPLFRSTKYASLQLSDQSGHHMVIPDGSWVKCKRCSQTLFTDRLHDNLEVCWFCDFHFPMAAAARVKLLTDEGSFQEIGHELSSTDPLHFFDSKSYTDRLADSRKKSGLDEAVVCGSAALDGQKFFLAVMDFRFMGASMGSVVGERITRMIEAATAAKCPVVIVTASGGARMQEGILSLMQMAKTCGALQRHGEAGLPYFAILTDPTYGGVTASFATVADVILAEPGAMIGFAGPRVIQETTRATLPEGFQTAEFLLDHGLVDRIVERKNLRKELSLLLAFFKK